MSTVARITREQRLELVDEVIEYPTELEGGRNLLTGTSEEEQEVLDGHYAIGTWYPGLTIGEEYTFSFDIKSENATYLTHVFLNNSNSGFVPNHPITKEWTRVQFTFKWRGGDYMGRELNPHVYPRPDYTGTYVSRIKLEKGTKATDWTPAPEDLGYDFPSEIASFKPGISSGGILLTPEIIEDDIFRLEKDSITVTELREGVDL